MSLIGSLPTKTTRGSKNQEEEDEGGSRRAKKRRYKLLEDNWGEEEGKSGIEEGSSTTPTPDRISLPLQEPEEQETGLLSGILQPAQPSHHIACATYHIACATQTWTSLRAVF